MYEILFNYSPNCTAAQATKTSRRFPESLSWIDKCGQQLLEIFYFLLGEILARCIFYSEKNLQFVNIKGDTLTNFSDFFLICQCVSSKILHFVELSPRFGSGSPIRKYRKLQNHCQICKFIKDRYVYLRCFTFRHFIS